MPWYPVQRQRLPLSASRSDRKRGFGAIVQEGGRDRTTTNPGVQKPHCRPVVPRRRARCTGPSDPAPRHGKTPRRLVDSRFPSSLPPEHQGRTVYPRQARRQHGDTTAGRSVLAGQGGVPVSRKVLTQNDRGGGLAGSGHGPGALAVFHGPAVTSSIDIYCLRVYCLRSAGLSLVSLSQGMGPAARKICGAPTREAVRAPEGARG